MTRLSKSEDEKIRLYNGDSTQIIKKLKGRASIDGVLTSPPYNNSRKSKNLKNHEGRYDVYLDQRTNEEYIDWLKDMLNDIDAILNKDGVILINMSYGTENPDVFWAFPYMVNTQTNFRVCDTIIWKKSSALPNNVSKNKMTRICEYVFVIARKSEYNTYKCNKKVKSISKTGQKYYENSFNFIEAKNNDGSNPLNKATYSTDFCKILLEKYFTENDVILDPFNGTGTTGVACKELNMGYIGIELSEAQYEYSKERIGGLCEI